MRGTYNTYIDYTTSLTTILKTFGNTPPIADIALTPRSGPAPQQVAFDGRGSSDSDGRVIDWRWDFGDGEQAAGPQVQHTYARPGRYFPTVTVHDDAGGTDVAVEEVDIGASQPPTVVTGPPTRIGDGFVTLSGSIDPRNQPTSYHFDYRPTSAYGATTPEQTIDPGDTADHAVSADLNDLVPGARYHYRLVAHNATGDSAGDDRVVTAAVPAPSAYRAQVMATAGLIAYWRLGELTGSTAADELGSRPGTYVGTVRLGEPGALSDDPDTAAGFDGLSGEMTAPAPELSSGHGSIEGWFDWRSGVAVMRDATSTGGTGWIVAFDNAGRLFYRVGGVNFNTGRTTASLLGAWHHIVVTNDGSTVAFYLDGEQIHTAPATLDKPPTMPWHIMRNGTTTQFTAGHADEIAIYDNALPATTVRAHHQTGIAPNP